MPTFVHNLESMVAELDVKIAQLEAKRDEIDGRIKGNIGVQLNASALARISLSLAHAKDARRALQDSCCNQNCDIEYA